MKVTNTGNQNGNDHFPNKYPSDQDWYQVVQSDDNDTSYQYTDIGYGSYPSYRYTLVKRSSYSVPSNATIEKITVTIKVRSTSSSYKGFAAPIIRVNGTTKTSPLHQIGTSYETKSYTWYHNPVKNRAWELSDLDTLEFGAYGRSGAYYNSTIGEYYRYPIRLTYVYVSIVYWYKGKVLESVTGSTTIIVPNLPQRHVVVGANSQSTFYAVFWCRSDSNYIRYKLSKDGIHWGSSHTVVAVYNKKDWTVYADGDTVVLVYNTGTYNSGSSTASTLWFKKGTFPTTNLDGDLTISWSSSVSLWSAAGWWSPSITKTSSYWVVAANAYKIGGATTYRTRVKRSTDGSSWTEILNSGDGDTSIKTQIDIVRANTGDQLLLIYCRYYYNYLYYRYYDGSSWGSFTQSSILKEDNYRDNLFSSSYQNGQVYIVSTTDHDGGTVYVYNFTPPSTFTQRNTASGRYPNILIVATASKNAVTMVWDTTSNIKIRYLRIGSSTKWDVNYFGEKASVQWVCIPKHISVSATGYIPSGLVAWKTQSDGHSKLYAYPYSAGSAISSMYCYGKNSIHAIPVKRMDGVLYVIVYRDGSYIYCRTSWDKFNWSPRQQVSHTTIGSNVFHSTSLSYGTYRRITVIYVVGSANSSDPEAQTAYSRDIDIDYETGEINTSMTWISICKGGAGFRPYVETCKNDYYVYVAITFYNSSVSSSYNVRVYRKTYSGSSWSHLLSWDDGSGYQPKTCLVPDPSSTYGIVFCRGKWSESNYYYNVYNGSSWSGWNTFASKDANTYAYIRGAYDKTNNKSYVLYYRSSNRIWVRYYSTSGWSSEEVPSTDTDFDTYGQIEVVGDKVLILVERSDYVKLFFRPTSGGDWVGKNIFYIISASYLKFIRNTASTLITQTTTLPWGVFYYNTLALFNWEFFYEETKTYSIDVTLVERLTKTYDTDVLLKVLGASNVKETRYFRNDNNFYKTNTTSQAALSNNQDGINNCYFEIKVTDESDNIIKDWTSYSITKNDSPVLHTFTLSIPEYNMNTGGRLKVSIRTKNGGVYSSTKTFTSEQMFYKEEGLMTADWQVKVWIYCKTMLIEDYITICTVYYGDSTRNSRIENIKLFLGKQYNLDVLLKEIGVLTTRYVWNRAESTTDWQEYGTTISLEATDKHEGNYSVKAVKTSPTAGGWYGMRYISPSIIDITPYDYFVAWVKIAEGSDKLISYEFFLRDDMDAIIGWYIGYPSTWTKEKVNLNNPDRTSLTVCSNCDAVGSWTGVQVSVDTEDYKEGSGSIKDVVTAPQNDTDYDLYWNSNWNIIWWAKRKIQFWYKNSRPSSAFASVRFYLIDDEGDYRYWNLSFNANEWTHFTIDRNNPDGSSGTLNLASVKPYIRIHTSDTTGWTAHIDYLRAGEFDRTKCKVFHWLVCTDYSSPPDTLKMLADWLLFIKEGYDLDVVFKAIKTKTYDLDTLIKKLGALKTYDLDVLLKKLNQSFTKAKVWLEFDDADDATQLADSSGNGNYAVSGWTPQVIHNCDSLTDWSGTNLSLQTFGQKEGTACIRDEISSPTVGTEYKIIYNPSTAKDWHDRHNITFWLKVNRPSSAFSHARVYLIDTHGNYRYWNLTFNANEWTRFLLRIFFRVLNEEGGIMNADGGSQTDVTMCESTADWSTNNPNGTISAVTSERKEGQHAIQLYIHGSNMSTNTDYYLRYNPSGTWDWSGHTYLYFFFGHCVPCGEYNYIRFYIYDSDGDWAYWNIPCNYARVRAYRIKLDSPDGEAETGLDLSKVDYFQMVINRSALNRYYQHIILDMIRLDDVDTSSIDKIEISLKANDTTPFTVWLDDFKLNEMVQRCKGKYHSGRKFERNNYLRTVGKTPLVDGKSFTVTMWFKPDLSENTKYSWLFYKRWGTAFYPNKIYGTCYDQAGGKGISANVTWEDKWYFLVYRVKKESSTDAYDGTFEIFLYDEDGNLVAHPSRSDFGTTAQSDNYYWYLGISFWNCFSNDWFNGIIDDFRVYDFWLTDNQITNLRLYGTEGYDLDVLLKELNRIVVPSGCVLYLPMDEGVGSKVYDKSYKGNDGTIHGASWVNGKYGKALELNGEVDNYIDCGDDFTDITDEFTIAFWMKSSDTSKAGTPISYATTHSDNEILLYDYRNFGLYIGGASKGTNVSANDGEWHHIVWTWRSSDGQTKLYKDGQLVFSDILQQGYTIQHGTNRRLIVGQEQDSVGGGFTASQAFKGIIDEIQIYGRALSEDEVKAIYNNRIFSYSLDVLFKKLGVSKTYDLDTLFKELNLTKTYDLDVIFKEIKTKTYDLDVLFKKLGTLKTYDLDVLLKELGVTKTYNLDVLFKELSLTKTYDLDAIFKAIKTKTYDLDVILKLLDATKTYDLDVLLKELGVIKSYDLDVIFEKAGLKTYSLDTLFKKLGLVNAYDLDVILKKLGEQKTYDLDAVLKAIETLSYDLDTVLKAVGVKAYDLDTVLAKLGVTSTYNLDVAILKTVTAQYILDAILKKLGQTKTYLLDVYIKEIENTKEYDLDVVFKKVDATLAYNLDVLFKKEKIKEYIIDVALRKLDETETYTIDMLIKKLGEEKTYIIDMLIKKLEEKSYVLDTIFKAINEASYDLDVILKKLDSIKTYDIDVLIQRTDVAKSYIMDLIIQQLASSTYDLDVALKEIQYKTYLLDLLILETVSLDWILEEGKIYRTIEAVPAFISQEASYQSDIWTKDIERREIRARVTDAQLDKLLSNINKVFSITYGDSSYTVWLSKCKARYVPHKDRRWLATLDVYILSTN